MNTSDIKRDDWIVLGVALLLFIDLIALPWFSISFGAGIYSGSVTSSATGSPDSFLGVLALITTLLVGADLAIERLSPSTAIPSIGGSRTRTRLILAVATAALLALKFVLNIHFSDFGFGFYAAVVLTAGLVYYTFSLSKA
jgi:hypothetical protein